MDDSSVNKCLWLDAEPEVNGEVGAVVDPRF